MPIERQIMERITIEDFCDREGLKAVVKEREFYPQGSPARYYAYIEGIEIMEGAFLKSEFANGKTAEEAIADMPATYSNKRLVANAWKVNRKEYEPRVFIK